MKDSSRFESDQKNDNATRNIKAAFRINGFAFFGTKLSTEVTVYAIPVGLGTILAQFNPQKPKPDIHKRE